MFDLITSMFSSLMMFFSCAFVRASLWWFFFGCSISLESTLIQEKWELQFFFMCYNMPYNSALENKTSSPIDFILVNARVPSLSLWNIKTSNPASNKSSEHCGSCRCWCHENDSQNDSSKSKDILAWIPLM